MEQLHDSLVTAAESWAFNSCPQWIVYVTGNIVNSPRPTLRSLAALAGVSSMTVLRVIRSDPRVGAETRMKVEGWIKKTRYQVNPSASVLSRLKAGPQPRLRENLAVVVDGLREGWKHSWTFRDAVDGAKARAVEMGYAIEEFWPYEEPGGFARLERTLEARRVRGLLIVPRSFQDLSENFNSLAANRATVILGGPQSQPPFHYVSNDTFAHAVEAGQKVLQAGYQKPGFACMRLVDEYNGRRYSGGISQVFTELPPKNRVPIFYAEGSRRLGPYMAETDRNRFRVWFAKHRPDVLITSNRLIPVNDLLKPLGLFVPQDVGWVTLDLAPGDTHMSGINRRTKQVAAAAIDLITMQLYHNETGVPKYQKGLVVKGQWNEGTTLKRDSSLNQ